MKSKALRRKGASRVGVGSVLLLTLLSAALSACAKGERDLPSPRPIVIRSGARLFAEPERMKVIDSWVRPQVDNIAEDPSFMITSVPRDTPSYPWESLVLSSDSAVIGVERGYDYGTQIFNLYAHYRLMKKMGRIGEFLPGGEYLEGFALERAIVERISDAWYLARAVYQSEAFEPLEEILFTNEAGYLDAMLLTARGDEFKEERQAWLEEDPEALERYRQWFVETFDKEPPGLRGRSGTT
jgi:hypothetical protein